MDFDDIYKNHKLNLKDAETKLQSCRAKLHEYLVEQRKKLGGTVDQSGGKVELFEADFSYVDHQKGWNFKWRFWNGDGRFDPTFRAQNDMSLRAQFSWSASSPDDISVSGSDVTTGQIDLEDFVQQDIAEHMATLMSEALREQLRKKFPHSS